MLLLRPLVARRNAQLTAPVLWHGTLCAARVYFLWALCQLGLVFVAFSCSACESRAHSPTPPATLGERSAGAWQAPSLPPAFSIPADAPKVVFLGDSIAAGLHLPAHEAYPAQVQERLRGEGLPFQLINAGVSGDTSAGGLSRLPWLLKQKPHIVVVELGGNDGLRGVPVAATEKNLRDILQTSLQGGAQVLLLGMRIPPSYGEPYVSEFAAAYKRLAHELAVPFVPYFMEGVAGVPALNLADGLHPTREGHARLATRIAPELARLLRAPSAPPAQP
ncbi:MAG: Esterase TesA [Pseudomonadota bacterium]